MPTKMPDDTRIFQRNRYDWDSYFDGSVWSFSPEEISKPTAFRNQAYTAATARGKRVHTSIRADGTVILKAVA
jgi:hypothetical protein